MDVIRCIACDAEVNALATGCPACGADPRTGEMKFVPPVVDSPAQPQPGLNSVALGLAVASGLLSLSTTTGWASVVLSPVAIIVGICGLVASRRAGRPASRATLAIGLAAAALVFALWMLGVWAINY
jgi:hypothetical protein